MRIKVTSIEQLPRKDNKIGVEWTPFKSLIWNTNDPIANLTIYFTSGVSLWDKPCY